MLRDPKNSRPPRDFEDAPWPQRDRPLPPAPDSEDTVTGFLPVDPPGDAGGRSPSGRGVLDDPSTARDPYEPVMTRRLGGHSDADTEGPTVFQPRLEPELDWADSETLTEVYYARPAPSP